MFHQDWNISSPGGVCWSFSPLGNYNYHFNSTCAASQNLSFRFFSGAVGFSFLSLQRQRSAQFEVPARGQKFVPLLHVCPLKPSQTGQLQTEVLKIISHCWKHGRQVSGLSVTLFIGFPYEAKLLLEMLIRKYQRNNSPWEISSERDFDSPDRKRNQSSCMRSLRILYVSWTLSETPEVTWNRMKWAVLLLLMLLHSWF